METRTYWIVAESLNAARHVAHAIHAGRVPFGERHRTEEAASAWAKTLKAVHGHRFTVFAIVIEVRTHHDGRIPVARIANQIGDIAASLLIVIGGAGLVGLATLF